MPRSHGVNEDWSHLPPTTSLPLPGFHHVCLLPCKKFCQPCFALARLFVKGNAFPKKTKVFFQIIAGQV